MFKKLKQEIVNGLYDREIAMLIVGACVFFSVSLSIFITLFYERILTW